MLSLKIVYRKINSILIQFLKEYYFEKYGDRTSLCVIEESGGEYTNFKIYSPEAKTPIEGRNELCLIRRLCGEQALLKYGITLKERNAIVILVPPYSLVKKWGFKKFKKFLDDWRGNSLIDGSTVVVYRVIGD